MDRILDWFIPPVLRRPLILVLLLSLVGFLWVVHQRSFPPSGKYIFLIEENIEGVSVQSGRQALKEPLELHEDIKAEPVVLEASQQVFLPHPLNILPEKTRLLLLSFSSVSASSSLRTVAFSDLPVTLTDEKPRFVITKVTKEGSVKIQGPEGSFWLLPGEQWGFRNGAHTLRLYNKGLWPKEGLISSSGS